MLLTEVDLAIRHGRPIASPIRVGSVVDLGLSPAGLVAELAPHFEQLPPDDYHPTRHRSIARFELHPKQLEGLNSASPLSWRVDRVREATPFTQAVADARAAPRTFAEAPDAALAGPYLRHFLGRVADLVRDLHPELIQVDMTLHFMRGVARAEAPADNAPEGIHEDGAAYVVSALVIARHNVTGAETRIYEQHPDGRRELLHAQVLQPGEFVFQADTGEEDTFGNDLWHDVTPAVAVDPGRVGYRDIIGVDVDWR